MLSQPWMDTTAFPGATHCVLETNSWKEFAEMRNSGNFTIASGGLGSKTIPGVYDTWACVKGHKAWLERCAKDTGASFDDHFCFAFLDSGDYVHGVFVPWGANKNLKLVKPKCAGA
jgi:hypothetical protein